MARLGRSVGRLQDSTNVHLLLPKQPKHPCLGCCCGNASLSTLRPLLVAVMILGSRLVTRLRGSMYARAPSLVRLDHLGEAHPFFGVRAVGLFRISTALLLPSLRYSCGAGSAIPGAVLITKFLDGCDGFGASMSSGTGVLFWRTLSSHLRGGSLLVPVHRHAGQ